VLPHATAVHDTASRALAIGLGPSHHPPSQSPSHVRGCSGGSTKQGAFGRGAQGTPRMKYPTRLLSPTSAPTASASNGVWAQVDREGGVSSQVVRPRSTL
jgi:hypothetical protein